MGGLCTPRRAFHSLRQEQLLRVIHMRTDGLWRRHVAGLVVAALSVAVASPACAQGGVAPEIVPRAAWGAKPANTEMM